MDVKEFISGILHESAGMSLSYFGKVSSSTKQEDNNQVLTEADSAIGKHIVESIKQQFPQHNIIDEESGVINNNSNYTWVVDPIDGTSNFANGVPLYGIMIGLLKENIAIAGGVALPSFSETYYGEKGNGAWCNGNKIAATKEVNLLSSLLGYGIDGHQEDPEITKKECLLLAEIVLGIRNLRSSNSVFDIAMVAKGNYGGYLNRTMRIWDVVAIQPILEESGCVVTDFFGNLLDYTNALQKKDQNFTICAAPPELYKKLQMLIHK